MDPNTFMLLCPFCLKEGKKDPVETPKHSVFVPAIIKRFMPLWAPAKGFLSLEEAATRQPEFQALIRVRNGRKEPLYICRAHLPVLTAAAEKAGFKIWTSSLLQVEERKAKAQAARGERALGTLASLLESDDVATLRKVGEKVDKRKAVAKDVEAPVLVLETATEADLPIPTFQGPEVGVSTPSRRGSLKAPRAKKVVVKEGKGHKPQPRQRKGKKNLVGANPDEIQS